MEKALAEWALSAIARSASAKRLDIVAGEVMRPGAIVEGERRVRRKLDGVGVVGDGFGEIELFALGVATIDVGVGRAADRA